MQHRIINPCLAIIWASLLLPIAGLRVIAQQDVADVPSKKYFAAGDKNKQYFLIGPYKDTVLGRDSHLDTKEGFRLVIIMPGGGGGADFHPFVKRIYKHALNKKYLLAQPVAFKWTPEQKIVWPTKMSKVEKQKFSTGEFVEAVIKDVKKKYKIDGRYVFTLTWSSSGPAAYAISLQEKKAVTGSFIAMSVFKPRYLPPLKNAKGHPYFLYHSPNDKVCPYRMAKSAQQKLQAAGAKVKMQTYKGGHGWRGDIYRSIKQGIQWLANTKRKELEAQKASSKPAEDSTKEPAGDR